MVQVREGISRTIEGIQRLLDASPFIAFCGMRCTRVDFQAGGVTLTMPMRPEFERGVRTGQFHGGPIAALIDTAGDFAVVLSTGREVPTLNLRVDYLRPAFGDGLVAHAVVRRTGRTLAWADVDVYDTSGQLVAIGRGNYPLPREDGNL